MNKKPDTCQGCPLYERGRGFAPPDGPPTAPLLVIGEALGGVEAAMGRPFVGPAGKVLDYALRVCGVTRPEVRVHNLVSCQPPGDWLAGAPWERGAIYHCSQYLAPVLAEPHVAIFAAGSSAARELTGITEKWRLDYFHGYVCQSPHGWVIPSYHPANILRGNHKLLGVLYHDLQKAIEVAQRGGWAYDEVSIVVDPEISWLSAWADALEHDPDAWIAVDIETPESEDDWPGPDDPSYQIQRLNLSSHTDEGVSFPWGGAYIEIAKRILAMHHPKWFWYGSFDVPRLRYAGATINGPIFDAKDAWHVLQSDMGAGDEEKEGRRASKTTVKGNSLGFVAPFYSNLPPWKHLSASNPGYYAAMDALQTLRCAYGITTDLQQYGQWDAFYRHHYLMDEKVLFPASRIGLAVERPTLETYGEELEAEASTLMSQIQALVPGEVKPEKVLKRRPRADDADDYHEEMRIEAVQVCSACGATQIAKSHRCEDRSLTPSVVLSEIPVLRWVKPLEFVPSPKGILAYIKAKGLKPGRAPKTGSPTTNRATLERLAKQDPLFQHLIDYRRVQKIKGTYVDATLARLDAASRIHPHFKHNPSTMRLSSENPNGQNVDKRSNFRKAIVAAPGCVLVEADFEGIEAVLTGWLAADSFYVKVATFIHSYLVGVELKDAPSPDEVRKMNPSEVAALKTHVKRFKGHPIRERKKRTVHGVSYGETAFGLHKLYPEHFSSIRDAQKELAFFFSVASEVEDLQKCLREQAWRLHYLGGPTPFTKNGRLHPYGYRHWFWDIRPRSGSGSWNGKDFEGRDVNRAAAYGGQSIAAGVLYDTCLLLTDTETDFYVGDLYHGETPIRALIHDSILSEVPEDKLDVYLERVGACMTRPIPELPCPPEWGLGESLQIGVEIKVGKTWHPDDMEVVR